MPYALAPLLFFALLTLVAAWPVVSQLGDVIIGDDNDVYINPWADWWTLKALRDSQISLWYTDHLFYPHGVSLHYHSFSHLTTFVSLTLRPLAGPLAAYNLTVLLHLVLAGLSMFHLARYLTTSWIAGLLAGIVFAFNSHNVWQTAHPVLVSIWPLPWAALFLLQAMEHNDKRRALVAAGFVFLAALNSTLMLILAGLWLLFILFYALVSGRLQRKTVPVVILFAVASVLLAAIPLLPLLREALLDGNTNFVIDVEESLPTDVLAPIRSYWRGLLPRSLHFGVAPMSLVFASFLRLRKSWPWLLFLVVVYLFAIGPQPRVDGEKVSLMLQWSDLVRPILRHTHRLNVLLSGALAVLVAYGWDAMSRYPYRVRGARPLLALLLAALIYVEYNYPPFPYRAPQVSPFYTEHLDTVSDNVALAILPTGRQQDKLYMYFQTYHGHKMTGGVVSRHEDAAFSLIQNNALLRAAAINLDPVSLPDDPTPALQQLAQTGVGYLVLDKPFFARHELDLNLWRDQMPSAPVYEDDLVLVFSTAPD